ncbi:MAG TPA: TraB/GumN family protein, partial [Emcibacteraceae bacterium]|nr:TraB/GumN family protein [Emcibacteraceae bacterium]
MKFLYKFFTNKIVSVLFVALFVIPQISNAQDELNAHPALWMIEKDNSKVYFLGSIHLLPKNVKWYGGIVKEVFDNADEVVFEVHMTPEKEAQAQQITIENGLLPAGDELRNYLKPEDYQYLSEQAVAVGIPA